MTDRVVLDVNGLKVSKPGYNVLTCLDHQLLFSSDVNTMGVYTRGSFVLPANSFQTIYFGTTFPKAPTMVIGALYSTGGAAYDYDVAEVNIYFDNVWEEANYENIGYVSWFVYPDRVRFRCLYETILKYMVLDYCG